MLAKIVKLYAVPDSTLYTDFRSLENLDMYIHQLDRDYELVIKSDGVVRKIPIEKLPDGYGGFTDYINRNRCLIDKIPVEKSDYYTKDIAEILIPFNAETQVRTIKNDIDCIYTGVIRLSDNEVVDCSYPTSTIANTIPIINNTFVYPEVYNNYGLVIPSFPVKRHVSLAMVDEIVSKTLIDEEAALYQDKDSIVNWNTPRLVNGEQHGIVFIGGVAYPLPYNDENITAYIANETFYLQIRLTDKFITDYKNRQAFYPHPNAGENRKGFLMKLLSSNTTFVIFTDKPVYVQDWDYKPQRSFVGDFKYRFIVNEAGHLLGSPMIPGICEENYPVEVRRGDCQELLTRDAGSKFIIPTFYRSFYTVK